MLALSKQEKKANYIPKKGYVPDKATAVKIAEAVWLPIYGKDIYNKKPFVATLLRDSIWEVRGTLSIFETGGVPEIEINRYDGRILRVIHGK